MNQGCCIGIAEMSVCSIGVLFFSGIMGDVVIAFVVIGVDDWTMTNPTPLKIDANCMVLTYLSLSHIQYKTTLTGLHHVPFLET